MRDRIFLQYCNYYILYNIDKKNYENYYALLTIFFLKNLTRILDSGNNDRAWNE